MAAAAATLASERGRPGVGMRRSPRPGSATSPHKHTPNFYSDNSNSSVSVTSGDSSGPRSAGPGPGEPEGRRARGSSCGEPALSAGVSGGTTWAGSSRQKPAPRSHNGPTACGAATVRGGASGAGGVQPGRAEGGGGAQGGGAWHGIGTEPGLLPGGGACRAKRGGTKYDSLRGGTSV